MLPIKKDKIVFLSRTGMYGGSPKYIAEALLRHKIPCKLIWLSESKEAKVPNGVQTVCDKYTIRYHLSTAHIIISDTRLSKFWSKAFVKKPGQFYWQTEGSGSLSPKKLGADIHTTDIEELKRERSDSQKIDYILSGSSWQTAMYATCYYLARPAKEWGLPRNDMLLKLGKQRENVLKEMNLEKDIRIALYAPTKRPWKGGRFERPNYRKTLQALKKRFGGEWIMLIRRYATPEGKGMKWLCPKNSDIKWKDVTSYPDMTELLLAADVLISDYSSCVFDYMLTRKPAFIYAPDMEEYEKRNGFYYPLEDVPMLVSKDRNKLCANILMFDEKKYTKKVEAFLTSKGNKEQGLASDRVVSEIRKILVQPHKSMATLRSKIWHSLWRDGSRWVLSWKDLDHNTREICCFGYKFRWYRVAEHPFSQMPIQENKIVFRTNSKMGFNCNPKYIAEEIIRQKLPYDLVWIVNNHVLRFQHLFPKEVRLVVDGTNEALMEYATAKLWILNDFQYYLRNSGLKKKKNQYCVQTWHASMGIKRVSDRRHIALRQQDAFRDCSRQTDYFISSSQEDARFQREQFYNPNGQYLILGSARNDFLFNADHNIVRKKVFEQLGLAENKRLLLYAPTWREVEACTVDEDVSWDNMDYGKTLAALERKFGGEWVLGARLHYLMLMKQRDVFHGAINVSEYPDMMELLIAADALITDYSSAIIDYMLTRKPAFFYASDYRKYVVKEVGMWYAHDKMPFTLSENNEDLIKQIECFDKEEYIKKVDDFIRRIGSVEDGNSSKRIVDLVKKLVSMCST